MKKSLNIKTDPLVIFIIITVESVTGIKFKDFSLPSRKRHFVVPRQMCMYFIYLNTEYSLEAIGSLFNKDHATASHAKKTINNLIETDAFISNKAKEIAEEIKNGKQKIIRSEREAFEVLLFDKIKDHSQIQNLLTDYITTKESKL